MALINVGEDSWLTEFSNLERLSQEIQRQITARDAKNSTSGTETFFFIILSVMNHCPTEYNKISARVRIQLKQFENEATQLDRKLQASAKRSLITRK